MKSEDSWYSFIRLAATFKVVVGIMSERGLLNST